MRLQKIEPDEWRYFDRIIKNPGVITQLVADDGRVWMTDCPQERVMMGAAARLVQPGDTVLTAGLGLGVFQRMAIAQGAVSVVSIERDQDIIDAVGPALEQEHPGKVVIVQGDVRQYMQDITGTVHFDFAYIDIWGGTVLDTDLLDRYWCLQLARCVARRALCWNLVRQERSYTADLTLARKILTEPDAKVRYGGAKSRELLQHRLAYDGHIIAAILFDHRFDETSTTDFFRWLRRHPEDAKKWADAMFVASCKSASEYFLSQEFAQRGLPKLIERLGVQGKVML